MANIGDAGSLAILPSTTIYSRLTIEEREAFGINENYVLLSAGIELIDDMIADLDETFIVTMSS